jgi:hypothetical protein
MGQRQTLRLNIKGLIDADNALIFGVDTFGRINGRNKGTRYLIGYSTKAVMGQLQVQECTTDNFMTVVQFMVHRAKLEAAVAAFSELVTMAKLMRGMRKQNCQW